MQRSTDETALMTNRGGLREVGYLLVIKRSLFLNFFYQGTQPRPQNDSSVWHTVPPLTYRGHRVIHFVKYVEHYFAHPAPKQSIPLPAAKDLVQERVVARKYLFIVRPASYDGRILVHHR